MTFCNFCKQEKYRQYIDKGKYVDQFGKRWIGKRCPDCVKKYKQEQYRKNNPKKVYQWKCETCGVEFETEYGPRKGHDKIRFCQKSCWRG